MIMLVSVSVPPLLGRDVIDPLAAGNFVLSLALSRSLSLSLSLLSVRVAGGIIIYLEFYFAIMFFVLPVINV
jgi:hypothetical protein